MRGPIAVLLLLCCLHALGQHPLSECCPDTPALQSRAAAPVNLHLPAQRYNARRAILIGSLAFIAGSSWGVHETVVHHPNRIPAHWNQQYWNADLSWRNKYKNGSPAQGPAFPGSTTVLVWTTDAKHLFATGNRQAMLMTGMVIGIGCRRPWWHYAIDLGVSAAAFGLGFHGTYSLGFRP